MSVRRRHHPLRGWRGGGRVRACGSRAPEGLLSREIENELGGVQNPSACPSRARTRLEGTRVRVQPRTERIAPKALDDLPDRLEEIVGATICTGRYPRPYRRREPLLAVGVGFARYGVAASGSSRGTGSTSGSPPSLSRGHASFTRGRPSLDDSDHPREEPSAGKPHARICGGEAEWPSYPTIPESAVGLRYRPQAKPHAHAAAPQSRRVRGQPNRDSHCRLANRSSPMSAAA
jgi:hypothetical protein